MKHKARNDAAVKARNDAARAWRAADVEAMRQSGTLDLRSEVADAVESAGCREWARRVGRDVRRVSGGAAVRALLAELLRGRRAIRDRPWRPGVKLFALRDVTRRMGETAAGADGLSLLAGLHALAPRAADTTRPDPILPRIPVSAPGVERARGERLLGGLVPDGAPVGERLPLLPEVGRADAAADALTRVPLLELADASGAISMAQGRGAPLDLRLVVESVLSVSHDLRARESVRIAWTVDELMAGLFPNGYKLRRIGRPGDWDRVRAALMSAGERWIPWQGGGRWWLLRVRGEPGPHPARSDKVIVDVALPPGAADGPVIDRAALRAAGVQSAPDYRTLIGVQSIAWRPGLTRRPAPGIGGLWIGNASRYPVLTAADRRRIALGAGATHRQWDVDHVFQSAAKATGAVILDTAAVDTAGRRGWRVVPAAAARAIKVARKRGRKR